MIGNGWPIIRTQTAVVILLPRVRSRDRRCPHACVKFIAGSAPFLELPHYLRIGIHWHESRRYSFEIATLDRKEKANRLPCLELHPMVPPHETPVHREGIRGPIGLNDAGQRINAFFGSIRRAANPEVPTRR